MFLHLVDPPGIEPGPLQCECSILPLEYGPLKICRVTLYFIMKTGKNTFTSKRLMD